VKKSVKKPKSEQTVTLQLLADKQIILRRLSETGHPNTGRFQKFVNKVVELRDSNRVDYDVAKALGDKFIAIFAIFHVVENGVREGLQAHISKYVVNSEDGEMFKFYQTHLANIVRDSQNATGHVNSHTKADFVEAMLCLAIVNGKEHLVSFMLRNILK
jgi:hypothetical protein